MYLGLSRFPHFSQIFILQRATIYIRHRLTKVTTVLPFVSSVASIDLQNDILAIATDNRVEIWDPKTLELKRQIVLGAQRTEIQILGNLRNYFGAD